MWVSGSSSLPTNPAHGFDGMGNKFVIIDIEKAGRQFGMPLSELSDAVDALGRKYAPRDLQFPPILRMSKSRARLLSAGWKIEHFERIAMGLDHDRVGKTRSSASRL